MTAEQWVNNQFSKQMINEDIYASKEGIIESHRQFALLEKQQERWSEEEVLEIIRQYALEEHLITSSKPDIWFKQFNKL
jgi:hypothetical protein